MGLDCSHEAFHGAYSAFHRFRVAVIEATGGRYERKTWDDANFFFGPGYDTETHPGLTIFLSHSDCDGEISPEDCVMVADELEALLPEISRRAGVDWGHLAAVGGIVEVTKRFIKGCREAAFNGEPLEFA